MLVFGENADDENLLYVLRKVLKDSFASGASNRVVKLQDFSPDLPFAGSRAAAMFELRQKDWIRKLIEGESARHEELRDKRHWLSLVHIKATGQQTKLKRLALWKTRISPCQRSFTLKSAN